ncbi:MAG: hypothetical protein ACRCX7_11360 [Cetobacterium sp.]|uniref:hypothetical protein n=1 Tax=Cetobacterium sp. TaxID=2071632 RepID=UPI003F2E63E5
MDSGTFKFKTGEYVRVKDSCVYHLIVGKTARIVGRRENSYILYFEDMYPCEDVSDFCRLHDCGLHDDEYGSKCLYVHWKDVERSYDGFWEVE